MRPFALSLLAALALATTARAADLTVVVRTSAGEPVKDAVVTLAPAGAPAAQPIKFSWPYAVAQQNIAFNPFVLIVPVGSDVNFPNKDNVRHHVYSFSPVKKFELKLYGRDESRSVRFDKAGIVPLGCNIHDQMIAYLVVVDTPYAAKTGADGVAVIKGLPAGSAPMTVWQPYMKAVRNQQTRTVNVPASGGREQVTADLRPAPSMGDMKH
ncbi:methylamine utilization protein [Phenylobacterium aquaticum]|uniref:methylamine utilization protein n=1 Tax=Phenylobacterium aquaticum TaxID=1763816 RepID=UPI001F5CCC53|nr:methylamine utilization protein [Phenylobacterium aquaticum]MCI3131748.1 methylamine utilization protein [Phenylobacterium aquaticum]